VPQDQITIGVPAYRNAEEIKLPQILEMPFVEQRPTWLLPGDGQPERAALPVETNRLLS
jgi:hypothetical protein